MQGELGRFADGAREHKYTRQSHQREQVGGNLTVGDHIVEFGQGGGSDGEYQDHQAQEESQVTDLGGYESLLACVGGDFLLEPETDQKI
jgi:hypothetical protein